MPSVAARPESWDSLTPIQQTTLKLAFLRWHATESFVSPLTGDHVVTDAALGLLIERTMPLSVQADMDAQAAPGTPMHAKLPWLAARTAEIDRQVRLALDSLLDARRFGGGGGSSMPSPHAPVQVVILGAGMDTRPWRLEWPKHTTVWEVDTPANIALKRRALSDYQPACDLWQIETSLHDSEGMLKGLLDAGFNLRLPVIWLLEGLIGDVAEAECLALLSTMFAGINLPGSMGIMTTPPAGPPEQPRRRSSSGGGTASKQQQPPMVRYSVPADKAAETIRGAEQAGWSVRLVSTAEQAERYGVTDAQQVLVVTLPAPQQ